MENKKQLKEAIKREYAKCAQDPVYFLGKYGVIQHPVRGKVNFNLYDFQEKSLKSFMEHDYNIVLKARQLGLSTLTAGYALWMMTFQQDKNILVIATKQETAKNVVTKVRVMHAILPSWLNPLKFEDLVRLGNTNDGGYVVRKQDINDAKNLKNLVLFLLEDHDG